MLILVNNPKKGCNYNNNISLITRTHKHTRAAKAFTPRGAVW